MNQITITHGMLGGLKHLGWPLLRLAGDLVGGLDGHLQHRVTVINILASELHFRSLKSVSSNAKSFSLLFAMPVSWVATLKNASKPGETQLLQRKMTLQHFGAVRVIMARDSQSNLKGATY